MAGLLVDELVLRKNSFAWYGRLCRPYPRLRLQRKPQQAAGRRVLAPWTFAGVCGHREAAMSVRPAVYLAVAHA
jgi:hypothetical protein